MQPKKGGNIISILRKDNSDTVAIYDTDSSACSGTWGLISKLKFPDLHANALSTEPFFLLDILRDT